MTILDEILGISSFNSYYRKLLNQYNEIREKEIKENRSVMNKELRFLRLSRFVGGGDFWNDW
jgi:hypothetical protein